MVRQTQGAMPKSLSELLTIKDSFVSTTIGELTASNRW